MIIDDTKQRQSLMRQKAFEQIVAFDYDRTAVENRISQSFWRKLKFLGS